MGEKARLTVSISADLRRQIEEAREDSTFKKTIFRKHSLSVEVEELLRIGLKARAGGNFLTLHLDDGIWAWLNAYVQGVGLAGSLEDTAIYFIRQGIIDAHKSRHFLERMRPHLPPTIQKAISNAQESTGDGPASPV